MEVITLYQTLKDLGNPREVESEGPFECDWPNTWLGTGFYLWDTFVDVAHWWGRVHHHNRYMIGVANCDDNKDKYLDLVGNTKHMLFFCEAFEEIIRVLPKEELSTITIAKVIEYMKITSNFKFEAIRAGGVNVVSKKDKKLGKYRLFFELEKEPYMEFKPAIQFCFLEKKSLNLSALKVIYPFEYDSSYIY